MYLSTLKIWNFRKYGTGAEDAPGLEVHFQDGVNVLIGENDSGKTAIVDAIRYVLHTKSGETIYMDEKDFHKIGGNRAKHLKIECQFDGISESEAAPLLEWMGIQEEKGKKRYILRVTLNASLLDDGRVYPQFKAGMGDEGAIMDGRARDLLRVVYLKPLRDALQDMTHGYKSRIAQILQAHSVFGEDKKDAEGRHKLESLYESLKDGVEKYFTEKKEDGYRITKNINEELIENFLLSGDPRKAFLQLPRPELINILRQLDLILEDNKSGLGSLNLLCVAAELLLFLENKQGLKLTLIEELEAHLHPQYQLRLLDYIQKESKFGQFILTTHSITLGANIDLEKLIVLEKEGCKAFPMNMGSTACSKQDYLFLHRFLDATKANLFFAKGVMMVEGDAENLLIPTIADIIDKSLLDKGVSIVNVGSTAYRRYVKIFQRNDGQEMGIPVAVLTDLDVCSIEYYEDPEEKKEKKLLHVNDDVKKALGGKCSNVDFSKLPSLLLTKGELNDYIDDNKLGRVKNDDRTAIIKYFEDNLSSITKDDIDKIRIEKHTCLTSQFTSKEIKVFVPKYWTLEYEIAMSGLYKALAIAIELAKAEQRGKVVKVEDIRSKVEGKYSGNTDEKIAYELFKPINDGVVSKAIVAQYLAEELKSDKEGYKRIIEADECLKYIVEAINHVTK